MQVVQGQWEELPLQDPAAGAGGDEANWNPIEWDRAAEELTWERLLGLDGSLVSFDNSLFPISIKGAQEISGMIMCYCC